MKALYLSDGRLSLRECPISKSAQDECLIKIRKAGICNTDLELIKGYMNFTGIPGHEFVGEVVSAPGSRLVGKRVVGDINIGCGKCAYCLSNRKEHCPTRTVLGILGKDGVFAEYITLPESNLHVLPDSITDEQAVFIEPLAAAIRIVQQVQLDPEKNIAVLGDGKLGLLIAKVLSAMGLYRFTIFGHHEDKLALINDPRIEKITRMDARYSHTFDYVIEATGTHAGFSQAVELLKPEGYLILKSTAAGSASMNMAPLVINELNVIGSRCGPFKPAIMLLESGRLDLSGFISGTYPLSGWEQAFQHAQDKKSIKVIIDPQKD